MMKFLNNFFIIVLLSTMTAYSQNNLKFDDYFINKTLRIDYYHIGDKNSETVTLDQLYCYGVWAGSVNNMNDPFNDGKYYAKVYDSVSGKLIFSKGFDSYFGEYITSTPAEEGIKRTYSESVLVPFPKNEIIFEIEKRNRENNLEKIFSCKINPKEVGIIKKNLAEKSIKVFKEIINGNPHNKVDIAVLAEGYTAKEEKKFGKDPEKFRKCFFQSGTLQNL